MSFDCFNSTFTESSNFILLSVLEILHKPSHYAYSVANLHYLWPIPQSMLGLSHLRSHIFEPFEYFEQNGLLKICIKGLWGVGGQFGKKGKGRGAICLSITFNS